MPIWAWLLAAGCCPGASGAGSHHQVGDAARDRQGGEYGGDDKDRHEGVHDGREGAGADQEHGGDDGQDKAGEGKVPFHGGRRRYPLCLHQRLVCRGNQDKGRD